MREHTQRDQNDATNEVVVAYNKPKNIVAEPAQEAGAAAEPMMEAAQDRRVNALPNYPFRHLVHRGLPPIYGGRLGQAIQNEEKTTVIEDLEGDDSLFFLKMVRAVNYLTNLFSKKHALGVMVGGGDAEARASARLFFLSLAQQEGELENSEVTVMIGNDSKKTYMDLVLRREIDRGTLRGVTRESNPMTLAKYAGTDKGLLFSIKPPTELLEAVETEPLLLEKKDVYKYVGGYNADKSKYGEPLVKALDTAQAVYAVSIFKAIQIEPGPSRDFSFRSSPKTMEVLTNPESLSDSYLTYLVSLWTTSTLCAFVVDFPRAKKVILQWRDESTKSILPEELRKITEATDRLEQVVSNIKSGLEFSEDGTLTDESLLKFGDELVKNLPLKEEITTLLSKLPNDLTKQYPICKWVESFISTKKGNSLQIVNADPSVLDLAVAPGLAEKVEIGSAGYPDGRFFGPTHREGAPKNLAFMTGMYGATGNRQALVDAFTATLLTNPGEALAMVEDCWSQQTLPEDKDEDEKKETQSEEEDKKLTSNTTYTAKSHNVQGEVASTHSGTLSNDDSKQGVVEAGVGAVQGSSNAQHDAQEELQQQNTQQSPNHNNNILELPHSNDTESSSDKLLKKLLEEDKEAPRLGNGVKEFIYEIYQSQLSQQEIMIHTKEYAFSGALLCPEEKSESPPLASTQAACKHNATTIGDIVMEPYNANYEFAS